MHQLDEVRELLVEDVSPDELRGMLRLRQVELEAEERAVRTRLAAVESRLRMIDKESTTTGDYVIKSLPAVRLVAQTATIDPAGRPSTPARCSTLGLMPWVTPREP